MVFSLRPPTQHPTLAFKRRDVLPWLRCYYNLSEVGGLVGYIIYTFAYLACVEIGVGCSCCAVSGARGLSACEFKSRERLVVGQTLCLLPALGGVWANFLDSVSPPPPLQIYWMHRTLHTNKFLYKYVHALHHKYNSAETLSPWASIAFNPLDGCLQVRLCGTVLVWLTAALLQKRLTFCGQSFGNA